MKTESILFIAYSGPCPPRDGKRQRTFAILQALTTRYQVDYLIIDNEFDFQVARENLLSDSVKFLHFATEDTPWKGVKHKLGFVFPNSEKLTEFIKNLCEEKKYAFIFSRYIQPVSHIPVGQKIIADIDDDFDEQFLSRIKNAKSIYQKLRLLQIYNLNGWFYKRLLWKLDLAILVKEYKNFPKSIILPNLPFQLILNQNIEFQVNRSDAILFVGKLTYKPNLEGIKWFIKKVFPRIQQSNPNASLTVVSNLASEDEEFLELVWDTPSVRLEINVQNLPSIYHSHALAIAPVFHGAGSNIKVIEALMMGKPVITTDFGARGFEKMVKEELIFCADLAEDFALKVVKLLENKEGLPVIQKRAFDFFQANYSLEMWNEKFLVEIDEILTPTLLGESEK